ncbi:MAG: hypothetical protein AB7N24_05765 [Dehalococcoidia bacterium]
MPETVIRKQRVDRLVAYLCDGVAALPGHSLESELGDWLGASPRFLAFADAHRDKIRKKLRVSTEPGVRGDVRAELQTAFLLLADRRFELGLEPYGRDRRGPDFAVAFRASHHFNLEVTRPRRGSDDRSAAAAIGNALLAKLHQLPGEASNALLVATGLAESPEEVGAAIRNLKHRADRRDEEFFERRHISPSDFQRLYRRLALLLVGSSSGTGVHAWANPEARRALPEGAAAACVASLAQARWAD